VFVRPWLQRAVKRREEKGIIVRGDGLFFVCRGGGGVFKEGVVEKNLKR
jgi:hypothetical protein